MKDIVTVMQEYHLPTILVVTGIFFVFCAIVGKLGGKIIIDLTPKRQKWLGIVGAFLVLCGIALYSMPATSTPDPAAAVTLTPTLGPASTPAEALQAATPTPEMVDTSTPIPTPTIISNPTITPLVLGELLFEDTFDDNHSGWKWFEPQVWIEGGGLHTSLPDGGSEAFIPGTQLILNNFIFETTFKILDEPSKLDWVAVNFRMSSEAKQYYSCSIHSPNSLDSTSVGYQCQRVDRDALPGEQWISLAREDVSPIDPGRTAHKITIVAQDDKIHLWVDDVLIRTVSDDTYSSGTIGLGFGTGHVAFDYVRVWALP